MIFRSQEEWDDYKATYKKPFAAAGDPERFPCYARSLGKYWTSGR